MKFNIFPYIHNASKSLKSFIHKFKSSLKTSENKIINFLKPVYNFIYRHIAKHKYIFIPMILLFIIPIMMSILFGLQFSNLPIENMPTLIVNQDTSDTVQGLVNSITTNETFDIVGYSDNSDDIKKYLDNGTAMVAILIPEGFTDDLLNGKSTKIMSFVDGSMTAAISNGRGKITEVLSTIKSGYLMGLAQGKFNLTPSQAKSIVAPMSYNYRFIGNPQKNMSNYMVPGLILTVVQVGAAVIGASIRERKSYLKLILKALISSSVACLSGLIAIIIQLKYFKIPFTGSVSAGILLGIFCITGFVFFGILLNQSQKGDILKAVSSCSIVGITMLISGYTFPIIAMPDAFTTIAKYMPNTYFVIPLRDIFLLGYGLEETASSITWLFKFMLIMMGIVTISFFLGKIPKKKAKKQKNTVSELPALDFSQSEVVV